MCTTSVFRRKLLKTLARSRYCQFRVRCRTSSVDPRNGARQRGSIAPRARPRRPDLRSDRTAGRAGTGGRRTPRPPAWRCGTAGRFYAGVRLSAEIPSRHRREDGHRRPGRGPRRRGRGHRRRCRHDHAGAGPSARADPRPDRRHQLAAGRPGVGPCQPGGSGDDRWHPARLQLRPGGQWCGTVAPGPAGVTRVPVRERAHRGAWAVHVQHALGERGPGVGAGRSGGGGPRGPHQAGLRHHVPDGADGPDHPSGDGRTRGP